MESIEGFVGSGSGYGSGYGYGSGSGSGYGYGSGIQTFCGHKVYIVDGVETLIYSVKGNIAKGAMLRKDLSLNPCYIAKVGNFFAHGETVHKAVRDAQAKYEKNRPIEDRISDFNEHFKTDVKYSVKEFYQWHNTLTGSCSFGRNAFAKENGINIESDIMTREEFADLTKNSYGSGIILQLIESWN